MHMSLSSGARVGTYEVLGLIGTGGMGEVYRARDTRLNREVALKVLPARFALDPERLARFQREAQVLASLNHPNIAIIHGLEESDDVRALVLELVEGPTLADRITQGPVPLAEALPIARQVADALAAAHEHGIIHRDLKPANIKLRPDGTVKVLDFGLAKALNLAPASDTSQSPTITSPAMTGWGVILGTAAYMSPEQARGKTVDKRSDIWAFGCVFYEMLTGRRAFLGEDTTEILASVVKTEPDWPALPADTPGAIRRLLRRCLQKDGKERLHDISDARIEMQDAASEAATILVPVVTRRRREWLAWTLAAFASGVAVLAASALAVVYLRRPAPEPRPVTFLVAPPENMTFDVGPGVPRPTISPDGTRLVVSVKDKSNIFRLWERPLHALSGELLAGTEGAFSPFWSPDSRFIGFFADGKLKKIAVGGGLPQILCDTLGTSGTWNRDGVILFSGAEGRPIQRVSAGGGVATAVTKLDQSRGERTHLWPHFLPDGKLFLYLAQSRSPEQPSGIYVKALDRDDARLVVRANSNVAYVSPGYLVYGRDGTLIAQSFDASRAETTGDPVPFAERVHMNLRNGIAAFAVSEAGVLAYHVGVTATSRLVWRDRTGKELGTIGPPGAYRNPRLSPDGSQLVVEIGESAINRDLWLADAARGGALRRFTFESMRLISPVWAPDGNHIAWSAGLWGGHQIFRKPSSGAGKPELLLEERGDWVLDDWLSDAILHHDGGASGGSQGLRLLPSSGSRNASTTLQGQRGVTHARVSPDGRWVAAVAGSGRRDVYVQDFPAAIGTWLISTAGGNEPKWRRDGKELFYLALDGKLIAVPIKLGATTVDPGIPVPLFQTRIEGAGGAADIFHQYDVSADGQRFLVNDLEESVPAPPITVVVNWTAGLRK
jgi:eukaryotic-like serine/threonine-protein kinase